MAYHLINSSLLFRMVRTGADNLAKHKEIINQLNVFPVPDGDTGTNMNLSMKSGLNALQEVKDAEMSVMLKQYVTGLLMGARGNSGVILSQLFKGFQVALQDKADINATDFANALESGVHHAYRAVTNPVEGTILSVAKDAANSARSSAETAEDLVIVMEQTLEAAKSSLEKTPEQLPMLKEAGVVDSGGQGLVVIYEGFLAALKDEELTPIVDDTDFDQKIELEHEKVVQAFISVDQIEFGYCTEFFVEFTEEKLKQYPFDEDEFREQLSEWGDSLLVAVTDEFVKVHIHTEHPGKALTIGQNYGNLMHIDIENMRKQHEALTKQHDEQTEEKEAAVITVALGSGIKEMMISLGATTVIHGGQTMNPSTEDLLEAIQKTNAAIIYLLPNNKNILLAANQAQELSDKQVIVIPTKSIPQGIGALFVFDETIDPNANEPAMNEALEDIKTGQITYATRDTRLNGIDIHKNAYIGMDEEKIIVTNEDKMIVLQQLIDQLMGTEDEILTVFFGEDVTEKEADHIRTYLDGQLDIEVEYHIGDQPLYSYLLMVE